MMYEFIAVERENALTIITINRPAVHNALNAAAHRELEAAFDAFEADGEQWVAILTGAGEKAFCAGHDLKQQAVGAAMGGGFEAALACDFCPAGATSGDLEYPAMKAMLASADFIEGPLAFAEKRAPRWKSHTP